MPVAALLLLLAATGQSAPQAGDLLFISPMGEPFRGSRDAPPEAAWFDGADANHDGRLSLDEMTADAARFFKLLDRDGSGEIDPQEIERYETVIAPEVAGRGPSYERDKSLDGPDSLAGGPEGPSRYSTNRGATMFSYLGLPEPVTAADTNFNRGVSAREFERAAEQRFALLDTNGDRMIDRAELPPPPRRSAKRGRR